MVDPINDIARQARQGSVSAIIQILNEKLADVGVRTRAVFTDGALQLLCEAQTSEPLEQATLVPRLQQLLESLQPRGIRHVNIHSRIVREQQLLWLDEIARDPENQLLWSTKITLARVSPLKRWVEDWQSRKTNAEREALAKNARIKPHKRLSAGKVLGGVGLGLLLVALGWALSDWLGLDLPSSEGVSSVPSPTTDTPTAAVPLAASTPSPVSEDPFVQAVRLAEQAVVAGQTAQTSAEWLELASRWQRASDLMAQVKPGDSRFATAQDRILQYRQNSESALSQAELARSQSQPSPLQN